MCKSCTCNTNYSWDSNNIQGLWNSFARIWTHHLKQICINLVSSSQNWAIFFCDRAGKGAHALLFLITEQEVADFSVSRVLQWVFFTSNIFSSLNINILLSCWLKYEAKESKLISSFKAEKKHPYSKKLTGMDSWPSTEASMRFGSCCLPAAQTFLWIQRLGWEFWLYVGYTHFSSLKLRHEHTLTPFLLTNISLLLSQMQTSIFPAEHSLPLLLLLAMYTYVHPKARKRRSYKLNQMA